MGHHSNHQWTCLLWSSLLLFLCMKLSFYVRCGLVLAFITFGSAASLTIFSPIDNENILLDCEEKKHCKKMTTVLVFVFLLLDIMCFFTRSYIYTVCISIGIIMSAALQLPCIFKDLLKCMTNQV